MSFLCGGVRGKGRFINVFFFNDRPIKVAQCNNKKILKSSVLLVAS
jgi:hypothetical protein